MSEQIPHYTTKETAAMIRAALRRRSGKNWTVRNARGTAYGWLRITAPPARNPEGRMSEAQCAELAALLGLERVHPQGKQIPSGSDYYIEYIDRAEGRTPRVYGRPYWD